MPRIPDNQIEHLKQTTDLVAVIKSRGVKLRKTGNVYKGRCPFHQEKTPSFTVNPAERLWHCFGCKTGGDVIRFVQLMDRVGFPEAFERLGGDQPDALVPQRVGVCNPVPRVSSARKTFTTEWLLLATNTPRKPRLSPRSQPGKVHSMHRLICC